jgi:hypothetical protein
MFKKGHNHKGGRPKGKKPRRNLTDDNTTGKHHSSKARGANKNGIVDKFPVTKRWDTTFRGKTLDAELVDYYIMNDLPLDDLFDDIKEYKDK